MARYVETDDGWFTIYRNVETGEKKFALDKDDNLVDDQGYFISKENARTN